jgi:hypothetical protein
LLSDGLDAVLLRLLFEFGQIVALAQLKSDARTLRLVALT